MSIRNYKKVFALGPYAGRAEFNSSQNQLEEVLTPITKSQIVDGLLLKSVDLSHSSDNLIEHKLGREPLGWIVVRKFNPIDVYESLTATIGGSSKKYDRKKFINFLIPGTTDMSNVHFWVF